MNYVACFGDSLIQGYPYSNQNSWIAEVEKYAEVKMLNYGVCGECCDDILARLKMTKLPEYVRHILFLGGANDIIQGKSPTPLITKVLSGSMARKSPPPTPES